MHMTGDLHEPCHTASLVCNRFKAPDGDHVATKLPVTVAGKPRGMHSLWDSMYCNSIDMSVLKAWEQDIARDPALQREALPELSRDTTVASWVAESFELAKQWVYDADVRAAIAAQEADPSAPFKPIDLSEAYVQKAQEICRKQGALAGFRLADTLAKVQW